ncbi:MAG: DUF3592 domain-containing protein [Peptococcaceae bacterium]|nr:DUF3592 domain-containing protein [Peptococcaceae bacterium]
MERVLRAICLIVGAVAASYTVYEVTMMVWRNPAVEDSTKSIFTFVAALVYLIAIVMFVIALKPFFQIKIKKNIKNGPLVKGTVISVREGAFINYRPELFITVQFTTTDGKQVTATDRLVTSWIGLARIHPGAGIYLRYNPKNPQKIILALEDDMTTDEANVVQANMQAVLDRRLIERGATSQEMIDIANSGVKAQGVILSAQPTGNIINGMGEMTLHIKVTRPDNGGTFESAVNKVVPRNCLSDVQPGSVIDVRYLPGNEGKIVIVTKWSQAGQPPGR